LLFLSFIKAGFSPAKNIIAESFHPIKLICHGKNGIIDKVIIFVTFHRKILGRVANRFAGSFLSYIPIVFYILSTKNPS
jgi:hypothetical protein